MRLTLRTLLAYLDDTLEPAAAKEIGQKLTESPMAQELVSRIREVTRRRRVTAPPVAGDDVDPNTLAEYLDNLLPPDAVANLEVYCLDSDIHLAEAAACHQILTLIGQPAGVSNVMRQRMYELVHAIESIPADRRAAVSAAAAQRLAPPPSVFSKRPMLTRAVTAAAIVLVGVVITWLVWLSLPPRDAAPSDDHGLARNDTGQGRHFIPRTLDQGKDEAAAPDISQDIPTRAAVDGSIADEVPKGKTERATDASEATEEMVKPPASDSEVTKSEPARSETATDAAVPDSPKVPTPPAPLPEAPAEKPPVVLARYVATSGVLLRPDESSRDWRRMRFRSDLHEGERVLCLPWYRAALQTEAGASIELVGETELMLLPPDEEVDVHIRLDRGRVILGTNQEQTVFQVDFLNQSWRLTLTAPENVVGIIVVPFWKPGVTFSYEGAVIVPRGEVDFQSGTVAEALGGPVQLRWSSSGGLREKESLAAIPAWMEREELTSAEQRAAVALEEDLKFDTPSGLPLIDAASNERKESRLLGIQCLGAIGRLQALIDAMNTRERREVRQAAIATLRRYIARGQDQEDALWQALLVKFSKSQEHAEGVIILLRGYSDADFQQLQKKDYENLIELLAPDRELLIRELAIMNLEDLAGKPLNSNYNPEKPKDSDIGAWKRAVSEGRLPPKVRGKM